MKFRVKFFQRQTGDEFLFEELMDKFIDWAVYLDDKFVEEGCFKF